MEISRTSSSQNRFDPIGKRPTNYLLRLILCLIVGLSSFTATMANQEDPIILSASDQLLLIGKQVSYLEDTAGELGINEILTSESHLQFIKHDKDVFSRPGTSSAFWFKIVVQNYSEEDAWLEIGSTYAWYVDFYKPGTNGSDFEIIQTGTMRPDNQKLYDVNFFWLPLNKAHESTSQTYYVRVVSGLTFELPLQIGTIRSLSKNKDIHDYLTAGFIGVLLIMLFYNGFIYLSTKDPIYLFYLGYLFLMALGMPYANGYPFIEKVEFLFLNKDIWNEYFLIWHTPVYYFVGSFCIRYLDLKKYAPGLRRIIQIEILIISGLFPLLNLGGMEFVQLVNPVQGSILLLYLTCLFAGYYLTFKRHKQAYYYVLGWTFMVGGAFIFFAVINGFLPFNAFTRNTLYFGVALEVWMFSLALGDRLNVLSKQRNRAQLENLQLIQDQNLTLERKVNERTEELQTINTSLSQTNEELMITTERLDSQSTELQELNLTKNRLFAIIGHDLRSPINSLKALLDLVWGNQLSNEEFIEISKKLKSGVEHVHFTLNNLLFWAKTQMGGMSTNPEVVTSERLVEDSRNLLETLAHKKGIKLVLNLESINVKVDQEQVNIILRNLISNAIKYSKPGGEVAISNSCQKEHCQISVTDNGVGLSDEQLDNLFKFQTPLSTLGTDGEKGTGLGLNLCQHFVEANGGKIWAENNDGPGLTFHFTLPLEM